MRVSTKLVERIVRMIDCGRGGEGGVEGGEGRRMWGDGELWRGKMVVGG